MNIDLFSYVQCSKTNGYRIYVDIVTGDKLFLFWVANMYIIYCSDHSSSRRGGDGVKRKMVDIVIFLFIRIHKNLVQDPRINKSIVLIYMCSKTFNGFI